MPARSALLVAKRSTGSRWMLVWGVALGSHVPEWKALQSELKQVGKACSARLVAVISTGNVLWCASRTDFDVVDPLADAFYLAVIAPRRQRLKRGERIDIVRRDADDICFARTYAGIYVLVVWISRFVDENSPDELRSVDENAVRAEMQRALPRIEALTISLPPPDPEPAEGVGKARA
jgi:hypothetical protein